MAVIVEAMRLMLAPTLLGLGMLLGLVLGLVGDRRGAAY